MPRHSLFRDHISGGPGATGSFTPGQRLQPPRNTETLGINTLDGLTTLSRSLSGCNYAKSDGEIGRDIARPIDAITGLDNKSSDFVNSPHYEDAP